MVMSICFLSIVLCSIGNIEGEYHSFSEVDFYDQISTGINQLQDSAHDNQVEPTYSQPSTFISDDESEKKTISLSSNNENDLFFCEKDMADEYGPVVPNCSKIASKKCNENPTFSLNEPEDALGLLNTQQNECHPSNRVVSNTTNSNERHEDNHKEYYNRIYSNNNQMGYVPTGVGSAIAVPRNKEHHGSQMRPEEISESFIVKYPKSVSKVPKGNYKICYLDDEIYEEKPQEFDEYVFNVKSIEFPEIETLKHTKSQKKRKKRQARNEILDTIPEEEFDDIFNYSINDLFSTENSMLDSLAEHIESIRSSFFDQNDLRNISIVIYDENSNNSLIDQNLKLSLKSEELENAHEYITTPKVNDLKTKEISNNSIIPNFHNNTISKNSNRYKPDMNIKLSNQTQNLALKNPKLYINDEKVTFENKVNFIFNALKYIGSQKIRGKPIIKNNELQILIKRITDCAERVKKEFTENHNGYKPLMKAKETYPSSKLHLERLFLNRIYERLMIKLTGKKNSLYRDLKRKTEIYFCNNEPIYFTISDKTIINKIQTQLIPKELKRIKEIERIKILSIKFVSFDCFYKGKHCSKSRKRIRI